MLTFAECEQLVSNARDKRSKPYGNNTRVEKRSDDKYALRLHSTDIATFERDGTVRLYSGGWRTVTTIARLREHVTRQLFSEKGTWYLSAAPDPNDPRPPYARREIPKPFHALDPGPEPVKAAEGCLVSTEPVYSTVTEDKLIRESERRDDDITLEHMDGYFSARIRREVSVATFYVEHRHETYGWNEPKREADAEQVKVVQCPHCAQFDAQHQAWDGAMNGDGWGRNRTHGYRKMTEMLGVYGDREGWQDAYLTEFREVREANRLRREWERRNRVPFEEGIVIDSDGYATRPDPKAIARAERKRKRQQKQHDRINKFVHDAVEALTNGLAMPSSGDCWGCALRDTADRNIEAMGTSHLEEHIRERYYVPSMFVNAMRYVGYQEAGIYMMLDMNPDAGTMGGEHVHTETVTRALRRYLVAHLIPEATGARRAVAA